MVGSGRRKTSRPFALPGRQNEPFLLLLLLLATQRTVISIIASFPGFVFSSVENLSCRSHNRIPRAVIAGEVNFQKCLLIQDTGGIQIAVTSFYFVPGTTMKWLLYRFSGNLWRVFRPLKWICSRNEFDKLAALEQMMRKRKFSEWIFQAWFIFNCPIEFSHVCYSDAEFGFSYMLITWVLHNPSRIESKFSFLLYILVFDFSNFCF